MTVMSALLRQTAPPPASAPAGLSSCSGAPPPRVAPAVQGDLPCRRRFPLTLRSPPDLYVQYVDFTDTLIIILRKKFVQLSFLHVYHHSTILLVWGWVVNTWPADTGSACYAYGAWVNAWVHVVMYGYYALTAVGIKPPFKSLVTMIQLTQFFSCIVHAVAALLIDSTPGIYNGVQVCYHIVMLRLFLPLLLKPKAAPAGKGAAAGGKEGVEVPATPSAASVRKQD